MDSIVQCALCDGQSELIIEKKEREFRKEKFIVSEHYYKCNNCKQDFTTAELDEIDTLQVYNQYREKYKILFPSQIKSLREKFGLSAPKMSEILGFGINVYKNYEKGEVPNQSNATLLNLVQSPEEFKKVVEIKRGLFEESEYNRLMYNLNSLIENKSECQSEINTLWNEEAIPNEFTGYSTPSFEKFANMVIFFLSIAQFKVKLNKLLYYADFLNYKYNGCSISGSKYQAIKMGPIVFRYGSNFDLLQENGYIDTEMVLVMDEYHDKFIKIKDFDEGVFNKEELDVLYRTYDTLKVFSTEELKEMSHKETGWINENISKGLISYQKYGFDLNVNL
ncbi:MAG: type II TA system antitoxin MqsA family protein [Methanococcaceae archaeon]